MNKIGQTVTVITGFKNPPPQYNVNDSRAFGERFDYIKKNLRRYFIEGECSYEEVLNLLSSRGLTHGCTVAKGTRILDNSIQIDKSTIQALVVTLNNN